MKIMKFGGSSTNHMKKVKEIVLNEHNSYNQPIIVVLSAVYGITNLLFSIAEKLKEKKDANDQLSLFYNKFQSIIDDLFYDHHYKEQCEVLLKEVISNIENIRNESNNITKREEKVIVSWGERITAFIFHNYLLQEKIPNVLLNALDFMKINEEREPDYQYISNVLTKLIKNNESSLYITEGYICRDHLGEIDNLGRGGSDYTASIIGSVLDAKEIQIWTDVSGMYNNDPRFVENTYPINYLTFDEAAELAYFGAKVLHPSTILPAQKKSIPVILKNTFNPFAAGTIITNLTLSEGFKAIAAKDNITIIQIKSYRMLMAYGFLRRIFEIFERYKVPVDVITTSEVSVSLTIDDNTYLKEIIEELSTFSSVEVKENNTIIACVGFIPKNKPGYLREVLNLMENIPIHMISYGSSDYNISLVIDTKYKKEVLNRLNKLFK